MYVTFHICLKYLITVIFFRVNQRWGKQFFQEAGYEKSRETGQSTEDFYLQAYLCIGRNMLRRWETKHRAPPQKPCRLGQGGERQTLDRRRGCLLCWNEEEGTEKDLNGRGVSSGWKWRRGAAARQSLFSQCVGGRVTGWKQSKEGRKPGQTEVGEGKGQGEEVTGAPEGCSLGLGSQHEWYPQGG